MFAYKRALTPEDIEAMTKKETVVTGTEPDEKVPNSGYTTVIHDNPDQIHVDLAITVSQTPTGYVFRSKGRSLYWQFDYTKLEHGTDILYLVPNNLGQPATLWGSDFLDSKDGRATAMERKNVNEFKPLLAIGIGADMKDYHVAMKTDIIINGTIDGLVQTGEANSDEVFAVVPTLQTMVKKHWRKTDLYAKVKTNDCIAALEAQVDLLTSWVIASIPEEFRAQLQTSSVLSLKDTKVVFDDMIEEKTALRAAQKAYLDAMNK